MSTARAVPPNQDCGRGQNAKHRESRGDVTQDLDAWPPTWHPPRHVDNNFTSIVIQEGSSNPNGDFRESSGL